MRPFRIALVIILVVIAIGVFGFFLKEHPATVPPIVPGQGALHATLNRAPLQLVPQGIRLKDGTTFTLSVASGFKVTPAFEGLKRVRFMAESPDGRLFVTDMYDLSDNTKGKVYMLDGFDPATGKFRTLTTYLENLRNPNSVAFYKDRVGKTWLYVALTDKLLRYPYAAGDTAPSGAPETVATFPDYGLSYKYGGWHLTRTVAFHNNKLYVAVGSSCNSCEEKESEPMRAAILEMNPDGTESRIYANGLRNAVGIRWVGNDLFATDMGVDQLGNDAPEDTFQLIRAGANYGWPYCYEQDGAIHDDVSQAWQRKMIDCQSVPLSVAPLGAHSAPLGFDYFGAGNASDPAIKDYFLVALHGSSKLEIGRGYQVVRTQQGISPEPIVTGFLQDGIRYGRPADVLAYGNNAFLFTDDLGGVIYYLSRQAP